MSRIKIKNFGPIREGFVGNDGWMDINKITVFIGDQGSGKSTVAKLISIFSWLEKNLYRGDVSVGQINNIMVIKMLCKQQELEEYFSGDTLLNFEGDVYSFICDAKNDLFKGWKNQHQGSSYVLPKIQYVSAARNLLTILYSIPTQNIVDKDGNIIERSSIPFMVRDLNKEYLRALAELAKNGFSLPLDETSVYYQDHRTFVKTKSKDISMSAASSGIQSITPLLLVSHFLSNEVTTDILDKVQDIDDNRKKQIGINLAKENISIAEKYRQLSNFGKGVLTKEDEILLTGKLKQYIPSSFINIVEEPEQNLFPTSQQRVINSLLEYNNAIDRNKLIVTTHSPYIIGYITLAIKANELYQKAPNDKVISQINEIVPRKSAVSHQDVVIYELDENDGSIKMLGSEGGIPDDNNYLDNALGQMNEMFSNLLDIEDLCQ